MTKLTIAAIALLLAVPTHAQGTRYLLGGQLGEDLNNLFAGPLIGIEKPIGKRIELDAYERPAPECKPGYGCGWSNSIEGGGIVWMKRWIGLTMNMERSGYAVSSAEKSAMYWRAGTVFRLPERQLPSRLSVQYTAQMENGLGSGGVETSHLKGLIVFVDSRIGCAARFCVRLKESLDVAHGLEQAIPRMIVRPLRLPAGKPTIREPDSGAADTCNR